MKRIYVGADPFPPYQYQKPDGTAAGSDYARVMKLLTAAGYEPDVTIADWTEVFGKMETGELDALFQVQDTPERLAHFYFSNLFRYAVTEIVTAKPECETVSKYADIPEQGYRLGVLRGFANGAEIDALPESCRRAYPDTESLLKAVAAGEVDFAVCDQGVRRYVSEKVGIGPLSVVSALTYKRALYVMFQNASDRNAFNTAMEQELA